MTADVLGGSFRDPHGFVYTRDGTLFRQVNEAARADYDRLMVSGLYEALAERGLLVTHEEADTGLAAAPGAYRVLRPRVLPFVSYPYEWCFSQLKAAALATLEIQRVALGHGMSLRDASAYNIQFLDARAVLIDTLSFEVLREGQPWVAYRQFCQHFLAPLALAAHVDVRLAGLSRQHIDGVPLDLASALLPAGTRMRPALLLHVHQHAKSQARHTGEAGDGKAPGGKARGSFSRRAFEGLVDNLTGAVHRLGWEPPRSVWSHYYEGDSYTEAAFDAKVAAVREMLAAVGPRRVFDLGANTGVFSRLAAEAGAFTVAFERDHSAVERNWRQAVEDGTANLLPLVQDLADPSPALGWAHAERASLAERGPADAVLALALVHHLAIGNNVPLDGVASYFRALGDALVVEFVPKSDAKTQVLLASRDDVFPGYSQEGFEAAFSRHFTIERRVPLEGSERTLYLMRAA